MRSLFTSQTVRNKLNKTNHLHLKKKKNYHCTRPQKRTIIYLSFKMIYWKAKDELMCIDFRYIRLRMAN